MRSNFDLLAQRGEQHGLGALDRHPRADLAYKEEGKTDAEIAEALKIGDASVSRVLRRFRETGGVAPAKDKGRRPFLLDDEDRAVLVVIVEAAADSTLSELVDELFAERGKKVSEATMGRDLRRCGFTRKTRRWQRRNGATNAL